MYKLIVIKIDSTFNFDNYLYLFPDSVRLYINSFYCDKDKVMAFTSAMLKYYYIPALLGINPKEMILGVTKYGKPYLVNYPNIDFNISHSGSYAVLAVAFDKRVGIDVELMNIDIDLEIKSTVFSHFECKQITNYSDFFILWAKKEAYLKCLGVGLASETYKCTKLNNQLFENFNNHSIITLSLNDGYILSACISNH